MGFLKWIKRDTDASSSSHKRRQSEPPLSHFVNNDYTVDEAYINALSKFNEWRNKQKFVNFSKSCRKNFKKSKRHPLDETKNSLFVNTNTTEIQNLVIPSDKDNVVSLSDTEDIEELDSKNVYEEIGYVYNRNDNLGSKSSDDDYRKKNTTTSTILYENEIHKFEKKYCSQGVQTNNINKIDEQIISSPPVKFYKENSIPFKEIKSPENYIDKYSVIYSSPKKPSTRDVDEIRKNEVKPPIRKRRNRSKTTVVCNLNKNCQNYLIQTETQNKKIHAKNISLPNNYVQVHEARNRSLDYEHQQHESNDDLVEHAQVINQNETQMNKFQGNKRNEFQEYVDDNFKFLENNSTITTFNEDEGQSSFVDVSIPYPPLQKDVIVTDLDQSEDINNPDDAKLSEEIMAELKSLELWSKSLNLKTINNSPRSSLYLKKKQLNLSGTYFCAIDDLNLRSSSFCNSLKCPIVYRSGTFRSTSVSFITLLDENQKENQVKYALQRNYLILRKLRHPNVALLMAICVNKSNDLISLITEPFEYTLHDILHKIRIEFPLNDCIDYVIQIIDALKYMHECKMIHSNISSYAVLISNNENNKTVKLSSFEMTTNLDYHDIKNELKKYENDSYIRFDEIKLSKDYLPYLIEYRKQYSQHQYQAPELIATRRQFVYPTIKSDIFGVTLLLWEMLNNRVPHELLSYADLEKLYNVRHPRLSPIKVDRCALFNNIIEQGICIKPCERFEDITLMKSHLEEIKNKVILRGNQKNSPKINESDSLLEFSKILKARTFDADLCDRTSTVKKRKEPTLKNNRLSAKELFQDSNKHKDGNSDPKVSNYRRQSFQLDGNINKNFDSSNASNDTSPTYKKRSLNTCQQDYYIPDTPIARNNKLLKVAWLNDSDHQSLKTANDDDNNSVRITEKVFKYNVTEEDSPKNKRLNVSIRITHGIAKEKSFVNEESQTENFKANISPFFENQKKDIADQIKYWNSLTSPLNEELLRKESNTLENYQKVISKQKVTLITNSITGSNENQIQSKDQNEQCKKITPEIFKQNFEEFFSRSRINDVNFESTLWRREKEKCEQNSGQHFYDDSSEAGVITPRRTSVKETVHKFENYLKYLCQPITLDFHDETREVEKELTFDGNVARMIESGEIRNISEASTNLISIASIELNEDQENLENQIQEENDNSMNVSKLDVVLRNNNEKHDEKKVFEKQDEKEKYSFIEEINTKCNNQEVVKRIVPLSAVSTFTNQEHPLLLALNLKKLCRRASDVGYTTGISKSTPLQKNENVRHSICGTEEIFKRLGEIPFVSVDRLQSINKNLDVITSEGENEEHQHQQFDNNSLSVGKLKCWNCGCHVLSVNEVKDNLSPENRKSIQVLLPPRPSFGTVSQNAKSVEDLYIDDDFNNDLGELCANIELGTEDDIEQIIKFSDIQLDFDVLSAEILSKLNSGS